MGVEFIYFSKPITIEQDNGLKIELLGFYDRGPRAVVRGFITYNEDCLDYIYGVDKSKVEGKFDV